MVGHDSVSCWVQPTVVHHVSVPRGCAPTNPILFLGIRFLTEDRQNTLEVLSQLLDSPHRVPNGGAVGLDLISTFPSRASPVIETFAASLSHRVSIKHSIYREAHHEPASSYIIRSRETGSRTIVNYNDLPEMTVEEFIEAVEHIDAEAHEPNDREASRERAQNIDGTGYWFHFEGRIPAVTLSCVRFLRKSYPQARVSVEVEKAGREGLEELAREAHVVFYSRSWAATKGYPDAEACVRHQARTTGA